MFIIFSRSHEKQLNFNKDLDSGFDIDVINLPQYKIFFRQSCQKLLYKDMVERAFKHIKGILNLRPIRVWLNNHIEGHIICWLNNFLL